MKHTQNGQEQPKQDNKRKRWELPKTHFGLRRLFLGERHPTPEKPTENATTQPPIPHTSVMEDAAEYFEVIRLLNSLELEKEPAMKENPADTTAPRIKEPAAIFPETNPFSEGQAPATVFNPFIETEAKAPNETDSALIDCLNQVKKLDPAQATKGTREPQLLRRPSVPTLKALEPPANPVAQIPRPIIKSTPQKKEWSMIQSLRQFIARVGDGLLALNFAFRTHVPLYAFFVDHLIRPMVNLVIWFITFGLVPNVTHLEEEKLLPPSWAPLPPDDMLIERASPTVRIERAPPPVRPPIVSPDAHPPKLVASV